MRRLVIAVVALAAASGAQAADLPFLRGSFMDAPIAPRPIWEGYYVGGQAGYSSTVSNIPTTFNADLSPSYVSAPGSPDPQGGNYYWPGLASPQANNAGYGGFIGYNSQWEDVVIGVEANYMHGRYNTVERQTGYSNAYNGTPLTTTSTASFRIDDFGSLRLRAGYIAGNFLPYAFFGGGVGNMVVDRMTIADPGPRSTAPLVITDTQSKLVYGYSAGVGIDVMLAAGFFLRAEYEYQRVVSKDVDTNVNSARAGIGYKF
jgi:outer membrane immunogenic protein